MSDKKETSKKVGNTSFQIEAIKKMSFKQFDDTYSKLLKGASTKEAYEEITGKKASE